MHSGESWQQRYGWRIGAGVLAIAGAVWLYQWWTRPPAVEFDNLRYIQLLWTAVSAKDETWLAKVTEAVEKRHAAGEMSQSELNHFREIIGTAEAGDWDQAARQCYEFAQAQLNRRRSKPASATHEHSHGHEPSHEHHHDDHSSRWSCQYFSATAV